MGIISRIRSLHSGGVKLGGARHEYKRKSFFLLIIIFLIGIGIGGLFLNLLNNYRINPILDTDTLYILIILAGFQVGACIGLIFHKETKVGGIFIFSIALTVLYGYRTCLFQYCNDFISPFIIGVPVSILLSHINIKIARIIPTLVLFFILLISFYYTYKLYQSEINILIVVFTLAISIIVYAICIYFLHRGPFVIEEVVS